MTLQDYIEHANDRLITVLQAEHVDAANNIESILDVSGFDAVLIGPYDLSASMGIKGQTSHPDVPHAIDGSFAANRTALRRHRGCKHTAKLSASFTCSMSQLYSKSMMTESGSAPVVERVTNENGFNMAANTVG